MSALTELLNKTRRDLARLAEIDRQLSDPQARQAQRLAHKIAELEQRLEDNRAQSN